MSISEDTKPLPPPTPTPMKQVHAYTDIDKCMNKQTVYSDIAFNLKYIVI